jgi:hypothetical protein
VFSAQRLRAEEAAQRLVVVGYKVEFGCDCPNRNRRIFDRYPHQRVLAYAKSDVIEKWAKLEDYDRVAEVTGATPIDATRMTWRGWEYNAEGYQMLRAIAISRRDEHWSEVSVEAEKRLQANAEAYKKARETGQRQVLTVETVDCNEDDSECDLDILTTWATPEGKAEQTRVHTY